MVGKTVEAWAFSILAVLGLVVALQSLGVNATAVVGSILHGLQHVLDRPL